MFNISNYNFFNNKNQNQQKQQKSKMFIKKIKNHFCGNRRQPPPPPWMMAPPPWPMAPAAAEKNFMCHQRPPMASWSMAPAAESNLCHQRPPPPWHATSQSNLCHQAPPMAPASESKNYLCHQPPPWQIEAEKNLLCHQRPPLPWHAASAPRSNLCHQAPMAPAAPGSSNDILCQISLNSPELKQTIEAKPIHIDDFWLDGRNRNIRIGRDGFKYYDHKSFVTASKASKLNFRLSDGIETFDPRPLDEGLNNILNYILCITKPNMPLKEAVKNADFVCFRGTLSALAITPYSSNDSGFKFAIYKFQDVFFIMQLDTDAILKERETETNRTKLLTYWGQKFETYIFAEKGQIPDTKSPVSTWNETLASFEMTLKPSTTNNKPIKLFYCAEIDGLDKESGKHIEAKTTEKLNSSKHFATQKSLKWWLQSHLAGIKKILVGIRTHNGIVKSLEWIKLSDIQYKNRMHWSSNICMQSIYRILENVREFYDKNIKDDEMLIIERKPNSNLIHYSKVSSIKYPILSQEFCQFFENKNQSMAPKIVENQTMAPKIVENQSINPSFVEQPRSMVPQFVEHQKPSMAPRIFEYQKSIIPEYKSLLGRPPPPSAPAAMKRKFVETEIQYPQQQQQFLGESWRQSQETWRQQEPPPQKKQRFFFFP